MTKYNTNVNRTICCPGCGHVFTPTTNDLRTLTRKQRAVFQYLSFYIAASSFAPSFEEIAAQFDYTSLATVHEHLTTLERKGYIRRSYNETRAIVLVEGA